VVTGGEPSLRAAASAASTTPLVMIAINFDPIARGYVTSLARPGSNITGVVFQQLELAQKQVEVLAEANPGKTRVAILYDEAQAADQFGPAQRAARSLHLQVQGLNVQSPTYDFDAAFRSAVVAGAQMALVLSGPGFTSHNSAPLAHHVYCQALRPGRGLMSYGVEFAPMWRRAAAYVVKILNGANRADLPIEQATKFEMVVNLKTAKAIGIELPTSNFVARRRGDRITLRFVALHMSANGTKRTFPARRFIAARRTLRATEFQSHGSGRR
jgi:putative tryptophan/tyrosine transport system substrate-binding protein